MKKLTSIIMILGMCGAGLSGLARASDALRARSFIDRQPFGPGTIMPETLEDKIEKYARAFLDTLKKGDRVVIGFENGNPIRGKYIRHKKVEWDEHTETTAVVKAEYMGTMQEIEISASMILILNGYVRDGNMLNFLGEDLRIETLPVLPSAAFSTFLNITFENDAKIPDKTILAAQILIRERVGRPGPLVMRSDYTAKGEDLIYVFERGQLRVYSTELVESMAGLYLHTRNDFDLRSLKYVLTCSGYNAEGEVVETKAEAVGFLFTDLEALSAGEMVNVLDEIIRQGDVTYAGTASSGTRLSTYEGVKNYWYTAIGDTPAFVDHPLGRGKYSHPLSHAAMFIGLPAFPHPVLAIRGKNGSWHVYGAGVVITYAESRLYPEWRDPDPIRDTGFEQVAAAVPGDLIRVGKAVFALQETSAGDFVLIECDTGKFSNPITSKGITIGDEDKNDIQVYGDDIAPWHALLRLDEKNAVVYVYDAATKAGTHVMNLLRRPEEVRLPVSELEGLQDEDVIRIANKGIFTYYREGHWNQSPRILRTGGGEDITLGKGINWIPVYQPMLHDKFIVWVSGERTSSGELITERVFVYSMGRHISAEIGQRPPLPMPVRPRRIAQPAAESV